MMLRNAFISYVRRTHLSSGEPTQSECSEKYENRMEIKRKMVGIYTREAFGEEK